jgi:hypothetical protein
MIRSFFIAIFSLLLFVGHAQENLILSDKANEAFDFWVGDWEVHWQNPDSSFTYGSNLIEKILDGTVIQENFNDSISGFKGTSISVFSSADSTWHQAWADNAGGYFDFYGIIEGETRIFQTKGKDLNGVVFLQRMVFSDIKNDSFTWNWENSKDGGETWTLVWQIFYNRK